MGRLAIFVERYTIANAFELESLLRFKTVAEDRGHEVSYIFRRELRRIPRYDAVLIRAYTDPQNSAYVASRTAEMHGIPVIDDSHSIRVCCDKVHMYRRLMARGVPIPRTEFLARGDVTAARGAEALARFGPQVILKAPHSSFSSHVEKVRTPEEFEAVGTRFLHRSDRIVVQEFVQTEFDWRVGVLAGRPLFVCRYVIPDETFKIQAVVNGQTRYCRVEPVPLAAAPPDVVRTAVAAADAIGDGLYGVDLKQTASGVVVIEVNDNPTINAEQEDRDAPDVYERIVRHLLEERRPAGRPAAAAPAARADRPAAG